MAEIAIISVRTSKLDEKILAGSKPAATALSLKHNSERFLSTVQVGITLVGILAGAYGGALLAEDLAPVFREIQVIAAYAEEIAFTITVGGITFLTVVIGELVPKSLAIKYALGISLALAPSMNLMAKLLYPLVFFLELSTKFILKVMRISPDTESHVTEDEIKLLVEQGASMGVIADHEKDYIKSVLKLEDRRVDTIMTHRKKTVMIDAQSDMSEIYDLVKEHKFSRYPVYEGGTDNITGVIQVKNLLSLLNKLDEGVKTINDIIEPPLFMPATFNSLKALQVFRDEKRQMAIIVDEYGAVEGVLTLHDIFESIVGDLPDFHEKPEVEFVIREDGSILFDGDILVDDIPAETSVYIPRNKDYKTLAGYLISRMNKIPSTGEIYSEGKLRFEIMDMDGNKIDKILVTKIPGK
ncbi:MAG: HlyC/CorC family transporter [Ignavibacteriaceae bacterium]|nr:hemolysin family protein [Ignavibacteriaceae bacterium]NUM70263.1 HlyC/CorC family transporter [Ignavibacteriaceae bacterium]